MDKVVNVLDFAAQKIELRETCIKDTFVKVYL